MEKENDNEDMEKGGDICISDYFYFSDTLVSDTCPAILYNIGEQITMYGNKDFKSHQDGLNSQHLLGVNL